MKGGVFPGVTVATMCACRRIDSGQVELSLKLSDIDESASLKLKQLREMKRKGKKKRKVMLSESRLVYSVSRAL